MIGVFDSGLGGLTVVRELMRQLPGRRIVYFGDTARLPYGTKGPEAVKRFAVQDAEFLLAQGAKAIIIACNTASALAYDEVKARMPVPVFEVITPAARRAAAVTTGRLGVIGTRGMISSGVYERQLAALSPTTKVFTQACPLFVPLVEEGWLSRPETRSIAETYLRPLRSREVDTLVLGCTHYPFLRSVIARTVPEARLVDPAREAVSAFVDALQADPSLARSLAKGKNHRFFVSDRTPHLERLASRWLRTDISLETAVLD